MNQESARKSLTVPFYVTFTFMHLGFHIIEMVNYSKLQNLTIYGNKLNKNDNLFDYSDSAIYTISVKQIQQAIGYI